MKSNSDKWLCIITTNGIECFNNKFKCLEDISDELKLNYNIIFNIASNRRKYKKYNKCRFYPIIEITRLP